MKYWKEKERERERERERGGGTKQTERKTETHIDRPIESACRYDRERTYCLKRCDDGFVDKQNDRTREKKKRRHNRAKTKPTRTKNNK